MSDRQWEEQFRAFFRRTTEDLRRAGEDVKAEAQRFLNELKDTEKQRKVRERLGELKTWARQTAEEVADILETGVKRAEETVQKAASRVGVSPTPAAEPPPPEAPPPPPKAAPSKTIGKRKGTRPRAPKPRAKTVGKKRT